MKKYLKFLYITSLFCSTIYSLEYTSLLSENKTLPTETTKEHDNNFDKLIQASFLTPTMQHSILKLHNLEFSLSTNTNNVPTIEESLVFIEKSLISEFLVSKATVIAALKDILEALEIAYTILQIENAYRTFDKKLNPDDITKIHAYQKRAKSLIIKVQKHTPSLFHTQKEDRVSDDIQKILSNHDFTKISNPTQAAFTLFLQCYRAFHQYKNLPLDTINHGTSLEKIYTKIISTNTNLSQVHLNLITMRQALQLALFIANKNSKINSLNNFSNFTASFFDNTLTTLQAQEKIVAQLCKDKNLGATDLYIQNNSQYDKLTAIAYTTGNALLIAGLTTTGLFGAIYYIGLPSLYQALPRVIKTSLNQSVPGLLETNVPWILNTAKGWAEQTLDKAVNNKITSTGNFILQALQNDELRAFKNELNN